MKKNLVLMAMLFSAVSAFTQEATISNWGYGLETSSGVLSGDGFFSREDLGVSVGVGFKLTKTVSATYRNADGSTFKRYFTNNLWQDNSTPNSIYGDEFISSEVVDRYQKTTSSSSYSPARYDIKTSGGETVTTNFKDKNGRDIGSATSTTPTKTETVKIRDASRTTYYYVYNVTVTRKWYTRTWYYKDRAPTTQRVYQDIESAVLVNSFSETKKM